MDVIRHGAQIAHVTRIPDARRQAVRVVRFGVDRTILGIDSRPSALGLEGTVRRLEAGLVGTRADAMGHLIESIAQRLGADLDRLKQDVVFWVARHGLVLSLRRAVFIWEGLAPRGEELVSYSRSNGAGQAAAARIGGARRARGVRGHRK